MDFDLIEQWLEDEAEVSVPGLDPMDRARFHKVVRESARNWLNHPAASIRSTKGKFGVALQFEGPVSGKQISVFSLRAHHRTKDFRFVGPNPDRRRLSLGDDALEALERLRALFEAVLGTKDGSGEAVTAIISGERGTDLVPLVEEARRTLDGGGDVVTPGDSPPRRKKKKKPAAAAAAATEAVATTAPVAPGTPPAPAPSAATPESAPMSDSPAPAEDARSAPAALELSSRDPGDLAAFYGRVLKLKPQPAPGEEGVFTLDLSGFRMRFRPDLDRDERKRLGYGSVEKNRGWGARMVLAVRDFDLCLRRSRRMGNAIEREDLASRRFQIRDPAGYLTEIIEA